MSEAQPEAAAAVAATVVPRRRKACVVMQALRGRQREVRVSRQCTCVIPSAPPRSCGTASRPWNDVAWPLHFRLRKLTSKREGPRQMAANVRQLGEPGDGPAAKRRRSSDEVPAPRDTRESETPQLARSRSPKRATDVARRVAGWAIALTAAVAIAGAARVALKPSGPPSGFATGNGRIEATESDIATKLGGRVEEIAVNEGDFVQAGQVLARMQSDALDAQHDEALAQVRKAITAVAGAKAQLAARRSDVAARTSDVAAAQAVVVQRETDLAAEKRRFARTEALFKNGSLSAQEFEDGRARVEGGEATLAAAHAQVGAAQAQVAAARAAVDAAQAQVVGAEASVEAAQATGARIQADVQDTQIRSPFDGRVQYRVVQPGEVVAGGHVVLSLVDLSDVYMTFFLPEAVAGKVALGSEVRVVLDAAPGYVIPASVSFVASVAQFTPKTVETASERQKLMFRVKAQIPRALLQKHLKLVKTGVPGTAWLKLDPQASWPGNLALKTPQ